MSTKQQPTPNGWGSFVLALCSSNSISQPVVFGVSGGTCSNPPPPVSHHLSVKVATQRDKQW